MKPMVDPRTDAPQSIVDSNASLSFTKPTSFARRPASVALPGIQSAEPAVA